MLTISGLGWGCLTETPGGKRWKWAQAQLAPCNTFLQNSCFRFLLS